METVIEPKPINMVDDIKLFDYLDVGVMLFKLVDIENLNASILLYSNPLADIATQQNLKLFWNQSVGEFRDEISAKTQAKVQNALRSEVGGVIGEIQYGEKAIEGACFEVKVMPRTKDE